VFTAYPSPDLLVRDTARLEHTPLEALVVSSEEGDGTDSGEPLDTHKLALVLLWLCSPSEEDTDILGHLRHGVWGAILVVDLAILEWHWHGDLATREVRVVVHARHHGDTRRGLTVPRVDGQMRERVLRCMSDIEVLPSEEGENVVLATWSGLSHEGEVWWEGAAVGEASSHIVWVWRHEVVRELGRTVEHLTFVIRTVGDLDILAHGADLILTVAVVNKVAVGEEVHAVAGGADIGVNLSRQVSASGRAQVRQGGGSSGAVIG